MFKLLNAMVNWNIIDMLLNICMILFKYFIMKFFTWWLIVAFENCKWYLFNFEVTNYIQKPNKRFFGISIVSDFEYIVYYLNLDCFINYVNKMVQRIYMYYLIEICLLICNNLNMAYLHVTWLFRYVNKAIKWKYR